MTQKCDFCKDTGWVEDLFENFPCPDCEDSGDPTRIALAYDPQSRRMKGVTAHGNISFDVPFLTQIEGNLWQGGTTEGLVLPEHIKHFVTLYPWEKYTVNHELDSYLEFRMYDSLDQSMAQVDEVAAWVVNRIADGVTSVHCFPPGTLVGAAVPTRIEDQPEEVVGHDGLLHKVLNYWQRPFEGNLVEISVQGVLPISATPEHPFLVVRPYVFPKGFVAKPGMKSLENVSTVAAHYANQPQWIEAKDLRVGDYLTTTPYGPLGTPQSISWHSEDDHPLTSPVGDLVASSDTAWMLGLYAADGNADQYGISFSLAPTDDIARVLAVWSQMGLIGKLTTTASGGMVRVRFNSVVVGRKMKAWFGKNPDKQLPDFVIRDGWDFASVIEGYAHGDGYYKAHRGSYACRSVSTVLLEQIRLMLVSVGEWPTISAVARYGGELGVPKPIYEIQWNPESTQHQTARWNGLYLNRIKGLDATAYEGLVYNMEVADVNSFTVNGVNSHNCQAGLNRSSLIVGRALMMVGLSSVEAIALIREKRSPACFSNREFERYLKSLDGSGYSVS